MSLAFQMTGFSRDAIEGLNELKKLIEAAGVPRNRCNEALKSLIDASKQEPLIKKLSTAVVFCSVENSAQRNGASLLGRASWRDAEIILDASVAIPYLLSSLFLPTSGRFSYGSKQVVDLFRDKGSQLLLPWHYLNECASHLVAALKYCRDIDEFKDTLSFSKNGYVSHYWQLKNAEKSVPDSLKEYLVAISPSVLIANKGEAIKAVMRDLQVLFLEYGVKFQLIPQFDDKDLQKIEVEYMHVLRDLNRRKSGRLVEHDVKILAYLSQKYVRDSSQAKGYRLFIMYIICNL